MASRFYADQLIEKIKSLEPEKEDLEEIKRMINDLIIEARVEGKWELRDAVQELVDMAEKVMYS